MIVCSIFGKISQKKKEKAQEIAPFRTRKLWSIIIVRITYIYRYVKPKWCLVEAPSKIRQEHPNISSFQVKSLTRLVIELLRKLSIHTLLLILVMLCSRVLYAFLSYYLIFQIVLHIYKFDVLHNIQTNYSSTWTRWSPNMGPTKYSITSKHEINK